MTANTTDPHKTSLRLRADSAASRVFDQAIAEARSTGADPAAIMQRRMIDQLRVHDLFTRAGTPLARPSFLE